MTYPPVSTLTSTEYALQCSTLQGSTLSGLLNRHFGFSKTESLPRASGGRTVQPLTDGPCSHRRVPIPMLWREHGTGMGTVAFATTSANAYRLLKAIPEHRTTSLPQEVEAFRIRQHSAATAIGNRLQPAWHEERGTEAPPIESRRSFQLIQHNHDMRTVCDCDHTGACRCSSSSSCRQTMRNRTDYVLVVCLVLRLRLRQKCAAESRFRLRL